MEVVSIEDERVEGRLVVDERHLHPGGYVHGGVWVAFADTVAAWGTLRNLPDGHDFTTVELKTNVFAPAMTGDVLAAPWARPLHRGTAHPGMGGALLQGRPPRGLLRLHPDGAGAGLSLRAGAAGARSRRRAAS